jgi:hypothetical protein
VTNHDELAAALGALRGEVRDVVPVPDAAGVRARARHQLRVRRTATALVAAAAVVAIAVGGNALLRPTAAPAPPIDTPTPSPEPITPSPRPAPRTPEPIDDPIVDVDWATATITVPPWEVCPSGTFTFAPVSDSFPTLGPPDSYPAFSLEPSRAVYGDLTGDGRAEAVLEAGCVPSEEGWDGAHLWDLLAVARSDDGRLTGLGWVGPSADSFWIADGQLLVAAVLINGPGDHYPAVPGLALSYRWDGERFTAWEPAPEYPPIVPLDPTDGGPPVRPRAAVASGLGCPDQVVQFASSIDTVEWPWLAPTGSGATYALPTDDGLQPYLFDLDRTGQRLLVIALSCLAPDGSSTDGLAVFERAGDGWQGISVLTRPGFQPSQWWTDGDRFLVVWRGSGVQQETAYRWTGTVFERIDE